jgi:hypothetical protein
MPKIGPDKWKHLYVGILMGAGLQGMAVWLLPTGLLWPSIIALLLVVSISYGWELLSKITGKGHYEIMDAIFSVVGGIIGMSAVLLVLVM